jgi:transcriptional regulator with XRE-family HTH domain
VPDTTNRSTAEPITAVIAERVRNLRERAGMNQADLAAAMSKEGVPWKRATVVNLEKRASSSRGAGSGGRDAVSVQEWLALALVFDVPPVLLIADPREQKKLGDIPITKHLSGDQWAVLLWLVGMADAPGGRRARNDSPLIQAGITVMEGVGELKRRVRTLDPEQGQQRTDAAHREALLRVAEAFRRIRRLDAEPPRLADHLVSRAGELGVDLYSDED